MPARALSDDADAKPEPEYAFEGFDIEFSTKVALTPPAPPKAAAPIRHGEKS